MSSRIFQLPPFYEKEILENGREVGERKRLNIDREMHAKIQELVNGYNELRREVEKMK